MKLIVMVIVMVVIGLGYLAKYSGFADKVMPATAVSRGIASSAGAIAQQQDNTSTPQFAKSSAQIEIAKKAIESAEVIPYATPEFADLLIEAKEIDKKLAEAGKGGGTGCEFIEHYYFGYGNGDTAIINWKVTVPKDNVIRITYNSADYVDRTILSDAYLAEFTMKGNWIDDIKFGHSNNPKRPPTKTNGSLRADAQKMVNTGRCAWE